jgi:hypothetical protein
VEDAVLAQHSDAAKKMHQHPILPPERASQQRPCSLPRCPHVAQRQERDGLGLLKHLQTMNASAMPADRDCAPQQLHELQMHNKEAIINFYPGFAVKLKC